MGHTGQAKKLGPACSCKFNMFGLIFLSPRITPVAKILPDGLLTNAKLRVGKEFYLVIPVPCTVKRVFGRVTMYFKNIFYLEIY